ncbi:3-hydroxyacyl-CoA dehydrogenase NAD-binding domain-containing protein [Marinomonas sp. BSi20584]|uniref:3-hydroxyacyl-CoA dehydrogenase NAD-binding domain-containing protein n=1 Tax=Marinomonas sp. BSi20584 TaxID=1594462 RepID=UPI000C1F51F9|nr:3-hydroxyacyl-CoA dehydrogenase NAD-binding domain-containing protein [Marinomonas sp. BSi20584]PJE53837.1 3-hydroxyacyl-CoA dehydrogenase [Marinomonas sp. BSi20584]
MTQLIDQYPVSLQIVQNFAVVTINNPPVNASTDAVRKGILARLAQVNVDAVDGVILQGEGRCLMAGADLNELENEPTEPTLPQVTQAIEQFPLPVVAIVKGFTLGGGLELALASDYRIAVKGAKLGLPEVSVGIVPGAGGTQRLPRAIGMLHALDMVVSGKPISAEEALSRGLVHTLIGQDSIDEVIQLLSALETPLSKQRLSERNIPGYDHDDFAVQSKGLLKRSRGLPSAHAAADLLAKTSSLSFADGVALEREIFLKLRGSLPAQALRYLFFVENGLGKKTATDSPIERVGVIGAGTMGSGICLNALMSGYEVFLVEINEQALEAGKTRILSELDGAVKRGKLTEDKKAQCLNKLHTSSDLTLLKDVDLAVEAIIESLDAKKSLFSNLANIVRADALLATNTSYLDVDEIFAGIQHPERVLGLHFFSPAHIMSLLEVVKIASTSQETFNKAMVFAKKLGKKAITTKNAWGFVGNRLYAAYRRQCEFLMEEGASPEQIDQAIESYGFAMGVFKVADMSGLDIAWRMREQTKDTRHLSRYVEIPDRICEAGRLGRKTGSGYYQYGDNGKPESDTFIAELLTAYRREKGIVAKAFTDEEIQQRVIGSLINESLLLLEEQVCETPEEIDIALTNGYGFPRWKGGPVFIARHMPTDELAVLMAHLADVNGKGHQAGKVQTLKK